MGYALRMSAATSSGGAASTSAPPLSPPPRSAPPPSCTPPSRRRSRRSRSPPPLETQLSSAQRANRRAPVFLRLSREALGEPGVIVRRRRAATPRGLKSKHRRAPAAFPDEFRHRKRARDVRRRPERRRFSPRERHGARRFAGWRRRPRPRSVLPPTVPPVAEPSRAFPGARSRPRESPAWTPPFASLGSTCLPICSRSQSRWNHRASRSSAMSSEGVGGYEKANAFPLPSPFPLPRAFSVPDPDPAPPPRRWSAAPTSARKPTMS